MPFINNLSGKDSENTEDKEPSADSFEDNVKDGSMNMGDKSNVKTKRTLKIKRENTLTHMESTLLIRQKS